MRRLQKLLDTVLFDRSVPSVLFTANGRSIVNIARSLLTP
jgi:DNA-binding transcriptional LysR family regulator